MVVNVGRSSKRQEASREEYICSRLVMSSKDPLQLV